MFFSYQRFENQIQSFSKYIVTGNFYSYFKFLNTNLGDIRYLYGYI